MRTQHTRTVEIVTYTVRCDHCGAQPPTSGRDALHGAGWTLGDEDVCPCRALGYRRLVTYTLPEEGGASLRAAGWRCIGEAGGAHGTARAARASTCTRRRRSCDGRLHDAPMCAEEG